MRIPQWALAMPRSPRFDLPSVPQHVVQRGHDRLPCFVEEDDYVRYLQELDEASRKYGCQVHAYVLMTNHVHLLMTPAEAGAISRMMQVLGRRYVRGFNERYRRRGTLWEGRYKSCLVDSDDYLLRCYRYIELNSVRARMVATPEQYRWSSYRSNALGSPDALVKQHDVYRALGCDDAMQGISERLWEIFESTILGLIQLAIFRAQWRLIMENANAALNQNSWSTLSCGFDRRGDYICSAGVWCIRMEFPFLRRN
ncbi:transposase [Lysobacter sp. CA199]|uniref:transposase n=1 Tax=Lysobacter sp. CA199 TaxID=3455608 RepID=UPI003F8CFF0B